MKTVRLLAAALLLALTFAVVPMAIACDATEDDNLCRLGERFDPRSGLCVVPGLS